MYHLLPEEDIKEHLLSVDCWCNTKVTIGDEEGLLEEPLCVHNADDGREIIEGLFD